TRMPTRMLRIMSESVRLLASAASEAPCEPGLDRRHEDGGALVDPGCEGKPRRRSKQRNAERDLRDRRGRHMRKLLHVPDIAFRRDAKKSHDAAFEQADLQGGGRTPNSE